MKKLIILAVIGFGAWNYFQPHIAGMSAEGTLVPARNDAGSPARQSPVFRCDGRQYCSQMTSRAEAVFFNNNCPDTKMDGDHDGRPCENDSRF